MHIFQEDTSQLTTGNERPAVEPVPSIELPTCNGRGSVMKRVSGCCDIVLCACAQVGSRYNPRLSIIDNIQLPPTLLSRFDLIYLVLDKADAATDRKLARHLVAMYLATPPAMAQVPHRHPLQLRFWYLR